MGKVERLATWLDHGKTVFEILVALGGGKVVGVLLATYTRIPPQWITPIWVLTSAAFLWLLLKFVKSRFILQQARTQPLITTTPTAQPLAAVNRYYGLIDPSYTGEVETAFRKAAEQVPAPDRDTYLLRSLTVLTIYVGFEILWWNIFGSQIKALQHLNNGSLKREAVFPFYADAAKAAPGVYASYSFDQWLGFLRSQVVIREDADMVSITVKGRDFLKFLIDDAKPVSDKGL